MSHHQDFHGYDLIMNPILHNVNEGIWLLIPSKTLFYEWKCWKDFNIDASSIIGKHVDLLKPGLQFHSMINQRELYVQEKAFIKEMKWSSVGTIRSQPNAFVCCAIFRVDSLKMISSIPCCRIMEWYLMNMAVSLVCGLL